MRVSGFYRDGEAWIAVAVEDGYAWLAPVNEFYVDVQAAMQRARTLRQADVEDAPRAVPVPASAKVLCAGLNYAAHAAEARRELPSHPDVFARWASTLTVADGLVPLPTNEPGLDWEGELAAVIGRELKDATPEDVEASLVGYTIVNDLSARLHQRATVQWGIGKNADLSAPLGPDLVTGDELADPYSLRIRTIVDGETMQDGNTSEIIFTVGQIGAYASETMTLRPGDVISTGTPPGIGSIRKPPVFLTQGQQVDVEIEKIGTLRSRIGTASPQ
jgi:2,4-didehydro-3-deoxy-L-rhamnonate hydrolase